MRKIVINRCYGGFGLSNACKLNLATRKNGGVEPFIYLTKYTDSGDMAIRVTSGDMLVDINPWCSYYMVSADLGETCHADEVYELDLLNFIRGDRGAYRDDKDLVAAVEEIGLEKSSGYGAELRVVEIPDDVEWEIAEYDGLERVEERHRIWV